MHLVSAVAQTVRIAGRAIGFRAGESIHTENAHKHTVERWLELAQAAGWRPVTRWISPEPQFGLFLLRA
jgi:uncharacterized SAM-dependent methyltransferase